MPEQKERADMQRVLRSGVQWLTHAAEDEEACRDTWKYDPRSPYPLPIGPCFELLAVDQELALETFDQLRRRELPAGPVLADWAARKVGFMLAPGSRDLFLRALARQTDTPPAYRYLETDAVVVVPGPLTMTGDRYEWLLPPVGEIGSSPLVASALAVMLAASAALIERAAHFGEADCNAG
ncbi:bifunctional DNA primase/polymerase [Actinacidiphila sp. ITFR-21]|uniref:bifunctional DNA primase/polymerase n=1 Tax=Actinacidiphila sp. ITFR-21 TaxID=3075199 RepID=UPI00288BD9A6|nr:bifunctional DNA primase/polymerase [Streptomyces sp. ITFR-21]WNI19789.1 bifunctional DNA primase/polymerase [Streptomyces sp. ITFR-21]